MVYRKNLSVIITLFADIVFVYLQQRIDKHL